MKFLPYIGDLTNLTDLADLEKLMLTMEQVNCSVIHRFSPGLYIRELHMPAGIFAIGHYQKQPHFNMFLKGKILTMDDNGDSMELVAPLSYTSNPGKKYGYILEDVVWLNIYPTEETDVETLEKTYLDKYENPSWLKAEKLWFKKERQKRLEDQNDYKHVLIEYGFTEEGVREQTENEEDQIPMPYGDYKFLVSNSGIQGKGVFASANIQNDEIIGVARLGNKRTSLGRYTNHSAKPNAKMILNDTNIFLVATENISGCVGGFNGEEITTDYRENLKLIGEKKCQQ